MPMSSTINVSGKVLGKTKPLFSDWAIPLPESLNSITLRALLTQIVEAEVEAFCARQEQRRLTRFLTPVEIELGKEKGKIEMGGIDISSPVDSQEAVDNALQGFLDGFYFVFIDEKQQESLDSAVFLQPDSQILFLRLTPLVGG